jgi:hypothetical protein
MLDDLSMEAKEAVMEYRAQNNTLTDAHEWLRVNYPHERQYSFKQFQKWTRTDEGKALRDKGQALVKEEASAGVAKKDNRILAVIEVTTRIMQSLRDLDTTHKAFVPLNRELRENLKYIAEETGDRMAEPVRSAYDAFRSTLETHPEWKRIAVQQGVLAPDTEN